MCAVARYYDISSKADRGDIFIVHDQKSSYRTPLCEPCWFVQRLSRFPLNKPKQTVNERERATERVCIVFYLLKYVVMSKESEISIWALTLCCSEEPLKVALKVYENDFNSMFNYSSLWINQPFERVVEWTVKDTLLPPPCGETMKLHWLEHAGEISTEKVSCPVKLEDQH